MLQRVHSVPSGFASGPIFQLLWETLYARVDAMLDTLIAFPIAQVPSRQCSATWLSPGAMSCGTSISAPIRWLPGRCSSCGRRCAPSSRTATWWDASIAFSLSCSAYATVSGRMAPLIAIVTVASVLVNRPVSPFLAEHADRSHRCFTGYAALRASLSVRACCARRIGARWTPRHAN